MRKNQTKTAFHIRHNEKIYDSIHSAFPFHALGHFWKLIGYLKAMRYEFSFPWEQSITFAGDANNAIILYVQIFLE